MSQNMNHVQFMISYDELFHICEYIELNDIINVRLTSKQFDEILNDDFLWKTYCEIYEYYDIKHPDLLMLSNKNVYKKCHDLSILKRKLNMYAFALVDMMDTIDLELFESQIKEIFYMKESPILDYTKRNWITY